MTKEADLYEGREHSKIKHDFLARYLQAASFKVLQGSGGTNHFTYVDGFAGPWSVNDEAECSDSSFDYAVRVLIDTREALAAAGRGRPGLKFLLCEKDPKAFERLSDYARRKSGIEIKVFQGAFEDNLDLIRKECRGFTFTFVDPKGWNLRSAELASFLASVRGDFLLNFMEHPISRHNSYELVRKSFGLFLDDDDWHQKIDIGPDAPPREQQILQMLKKRLRAKGAAQFLPDFPILKPRAERIQMRLVLGTQHVEGVEVFRTVQAKAEGIQAETRRTISDDGVGQGSLFSTELLNAMDLDGTGVGGRRSLIRAKQRCIEILGAHGRELLFVDLASLVMEDVPVRRTHVKDVLAELRSAGIVSYDTAGTSRKPNDRGIVSLLF